MCISEHEAANTLFRSVYRNRRSTVTGVTILTGAAVPFYFFYIRFPPSAICDSNLLVWATMGAHSSHEITSRLRSQWVNPGNILDLLLLVGGDVIAIALPQLSGSRWPTSGSLLIRLGCLRL